VLLRIFSLFGNRCQMQAATTGIKNARCKLNTEEKFSRDQFILASCLLPDQDSNLNCQSQNLTYYHYTIGQ
jgi:hypothetical protein